MQPIDEDPQGGASSSEHFDSGMDDTRDEKSPIARLPPEVLLRIFKHVVAVEHYERTYGPPPPEPLVVSYFSLIHVCRYWRTLARADPTLWTTPDFDHPPLALEMLALARDMPLSVNVRANHSHVRGFADVIDELAKLPPRDIRELYITEIVRWPGWMNKFTSSMPTLEQLYLERSSAAGITPHIHDLVSGDFPHLRKLTLIGVTIPWHSKCLSNLTSLTIEIAAFPVIDSDIVAVLRHNPALEKLTLFNITSRDAVRGIPWDARSSLNLVHLPCLQDLVLNDYADALCVLLSLMIVPRLVSLEVGLGPDNDSSSVFQNAAEASSNLFPGFSCHLCSIVDGMGIQIDRVEANCRGRIVHFSPNNFAAYHLRLRCHGWRRTSTNQGAKYMPPFVMTLSFWLCGDPPQPGPVGFLADFLEHLPLENVQRVVVACHLEQACDTRSSQQHLHRLWKILSTMPLLDSLTIRRHLAFGIAPGLLAALDDDPPEQFGSATESEATLKLPFPALQSLVYEADAVYPLQSCLQSQILALKSFSRRRDSSGKVPPLDIELRQDFPGKKAVVKVHNGEGSLVETDGPVPTFADAWQAVRHEIHAQSWYLSSSHNG